MKFKTIFKTKIQNYSKFIKIVEVGPRDGLQNEKSIIPTSTKISLINQLSQTGLLSIETTSFVSPKWVPQMADAKDVYSSIVKNPRVSYPCLVPNLKGYTAAKQLNVKEIAIFASASESFSQKNLNCSIQESLENYKSVTEQAKIDGIKIRGYVSVVAGCPFEGFVDPKQVSKVTRELIEMGCFEVSLGDTIGVGTPNTIQAMIDIVKSDVDVSKLAVHFHDTFGMAIANIYKSLDLGIGVVDSSISGLGGCPYAKGATGNVATEDVVYLLHGLGLETGISLDKLILVGDYISKELNRQNGSRAGNALLKKIYS